MPDGVNGPGRKIVLFRIGGQECALPVEAVREILPMAALLRAPGQPSILEGFLNLRGTAVPVVRLDRLFDRSGGGPGPGTPLLLVRGAGGEAAFLVERAIGIASIAPGALMPIDRHSSFNDCVEAETVVEGRTVAVLSADRLLLEKERQCLAELQSAAQKRLEELQEAATA
jgi:purine-binding chemotaxis protein CheW